MSSQNLTVIEGGALAVAQPKDTNDYVSRQEAARRACETAGIVWPGTILPEGTALYTSGVEKLKNDRAAWRRLPLAGEVVGLVKNALDAEDRRDYVEEVGGLAFHPENGRIVRRANLGNPNIKGLGYGPHTLRQLVQQIDPLDDAPRGFSSALLYLSDRERAEILNKRIDKSNPETKVTLRTKLPHVGAESRIARAALSQVYGSVTDSDIAQVLGEVLNGDRSGRMDYKPGDNRSRFEIIWPSEIPVETFVVGDVHYGVLSIDNGETGMNSLRIAPGVVRAACANLTLSFGTGTEVTIKHVGDEDKLIFRLKKAIRAALDDMEPLLATISMSARIPVGGEWSTAKVFEALAKRFDLGQAAPKLWIAQHESSRYPDSVFGIQAAISEAAHKRDTWTDEAEWEKVASVFQAKAVEVVKAGSTASKAIEKALSVN